MRNGISPLLSAVLLAAIAVGLGTGAYMFLGESQEFIEGQTQQAQLETVNITCTSSIVTWWITNTRQYTVDQTEGDILVRHNGDFDPDNTRENVQLNYEFTSRHGTDRIEITPATPLQNGDQYTFELDYGENTVRADCRAGTAWFDTNWDYRRQIQFQNSGSPQERVELDTETLVQNGKIRADCHDLRAIQNNRVINYDVSQCNTDQTRVSIDKTGGIGTAYLYYGNPTAQDNQTSLGGSPPLATLGNEEAVPLPQ